MTEITQEQLERAGYGVKAAPDGAWRKYDERRPIPGYFQFDWLSSRHPDLYHMFALSTLGFMHELETLVDLAGLDVIDLGAGTGRVALEAAQKADKVAAVDFFESVVVYGREIMRRSGIKNVHYLIGDNGHLPLPENSMDAAICAWAYWNHAEAHRVVKPDGWLISLVPAPGAWCGELTATLADVYPEIITEIGPAAPLDPAFPDADSLIRKNTWNGVPVTAPIRVHDFTYVAEYGDPIEAAAILGRLYGPKAKSYMLDRRQSTLAWRLRIEICHTRK
ncbi:MAG: class I SAM-dependent methyltransferase [Anaerolineales bacterium]